MKLSSIKTIEEKMTLTDALNVLTELAQEVVDGTLVVMTEDTSQEREAIDVVRSFIEQITLLQ